MSLAGLLAALERDTEDRVAAGLAAAGEEASAIREESGRHLARQREAALREAGDALARERQGELSRTTRRVRGEVMESRETAIGRVIERVRGLAAHPDAAVMPPAVLAALTAAALGFVAGEPSVIRGNAALLASLADQLGNAGHRLEDDPGVGAGVIITTGDGRVTVDATLVGWLSAREQEVRMIIGRLLEEPG